MARAGRASVAQRRKNWDTAVSDLKRCLSSIRKRGGPLPLGSNAVHAEQFQEGYDEFKDAKTKDKNLPDPNVATALMYDQLKIADKAAKTQQFFDRAMATNKTDPATVTAYAQWLDQAGHAADARQSGSACWPRPAKRTRAISTC